MKRWVYACFDELAKIASQELSTADKRRQAIQFAALGGAAFPAMSATSSKIMTGKFMPKGVKFKRWLPATVITGLLSGGALPAAQHMIARKNLSDAAQLSATKKLISQVAPEGLSNKVPKLPEL